MERNTLIAIVLSVCVLFAYQAVFVPPKRAVSVNNSQVNSIQGIASENSNSSPAQTQSANSSTNVIEKTVDYTVKNTETVFSYSNVGGSLHKIEFLGNNPFPAADILSVGGLDNAKYVGQQIDENTIALVYHDKNWQITKTYQAQDKNLIKARLEIKSLGEMSNLSNLSIKALGIDENDINVNQNSRESALYEYSVYANNKIFRKGSAIKFSDKNYKSESAKINWVGFRDRYHAIVIKPEFETKTYEIKADNAQQLNIFITPQSKELTAGQSVTLDFDIYVGPQNPGLMKKYGQGFEKIVAFSNFIIIEWIAQAIYYTIPVIHSIFKSWGIAIILMSALIYGITYPLTLKSMMSMRKMQEVQPKIKALQERYKNDPQKAQAEVMEIYRREKINPLGGCLPFLIQMPFFMALYQILWRAQYFQGQGFLWIKDLSMPDRLAIFPFSLPLFANELNILPLITGCIMFFQQKISARNMVTTDEQQVMQQQMMMYLLPVMMTCMFYRFASSWALYFLVFYILSTLAQWQIAKASGKK